MTFVITQKKGLLINKVQKGMTKKKGKPYNKEQAMDYLIRNYTKTKVNERNNK